MALQDDINALSDRLAKVVAEVQALTAPTVTADLTAITAQVTTVETSVADLKAKLGQ